MTLTEKIIELVLEIVDRTCGKCANVGCTDHIGYGSDRPITLADVLRAISFIGEWEVDGLIGSGIHIACTSRGSFVDGYGNLLSDTNAWDLTTDLEGQSDETKAFISKVLGL